jgi:hypothetical protein
LSDQGVDASITAEERNYWRFRSPVTDFAVHRGDLYGGYLSFDVITFSEFDFMETRYPLVEIALEYHA